MVILIVLYLTGNKVPFDINSLLCWNKYIVSQNCINFHLAI